MAVRKLETPVDVLTGMPLPIITLPEINHLKDPRNKNWHHHYHPAKHELLQGVGGAAIRHCRLQKVPAELHNFGKATYHDYFKGPPLPENPTDQFALTVMACAGYIPKEGIEISKSGAKVLELSPKQTAALKSLKNKEYRNFRYDEVLVRQFFEQFALAQDLSYLQEGTIEEFLTSKDLRRRQYLGHFILAKAVEIATDDVYDNYLYAYQEGLLNPHAPPSPRDVVKTRIVTPKNHEKVFESIEIALSEQFGFAS